MEGIDLYEAIREMHRLTAEGVPFSFVFATYNRDSRTTEGIRVVRKAKLRPKTKDDQIKHSSFKLFFYDLEINQPRVCWQPLIMYFNNKKIILN